MTSLFNAMIANLSDTARQASPTSFHQFLKSLDDMGKLTRVYTQNIDCLEEKAGLTFGVPSASSSESKKAKDQLPSPPPDAPDSSSHDMSNENNAAGSSSTPAKESISKCIPLHGHVQTMYCTRCFQSVPLWEHMAKLQIGESVPCSACEDLETTRRLVGKRERGVGSLRPSVVLYGEAHREGEVIGECVRRDLLGIRRGKVDPKAINRRPPPAPKTPPETPSRSRSNPVPDLLIVAGTSLKVPGTKRIVREFAKAVKSSSKSSPQSRNLQLLTPASSPAPGGSPKSSSRGSSGSSTKPRSILLNFDFPAPSRDWENVFDTWIHGDLQLFAEKVEQELCIQAEKKRQRGEQSSSTKSKSSSHSSKKKSSKGSPDISGTDEDRPRKKQRTASPKDSLHFLPERSYPSLPPPFVVIPARKIPTTPVRRATPSPSTPPHRIRRVSLKLPHSESVTPVRPLSPHSSHRDASSFNDQKFKRPRSLSFDVTVEIPPFPKRVFHDDDNGPLSPSLERSIRRVEHGVRD
ncbi:hypothetical protein FRC02_007320 [Tulasnella sp. 418]|nr:hypothetical protein FRC02_007320 [Tulasnella sp. 418]